MSYYGIVSPAFWNGPTGRAIRVEGPHAQLLALYLMTNREANMIGLYRLFSEDVVHETGLTVVQVASGYQALASVGFAYYDGTSAFVWVPQMPRFRLNLPKGVALGEKDKRVIAAHRLYAALDPNPFLGQFFDQHQGLLHLQEKREGVGKVYTSPLEGASKDLPSQITDNRLQIADNRQQIAAADRGTVALRAPDAADAAAGARKKRPVFKGTTFAVFEWQERELMGMLAGCAEAFDLFSFFQDLDVRCAAGGQVMPPKDLQWNWLQQQVLGEARRRGLPMTPTLTPVPEMGKQTSRLMQAVATAVQRGPDYDQLRGLRAPLRGALSPAPANGRGRADDSGVLPHAQEPAARMSHRRGGRDGDDERVVSEDVGVVGRGNGESSETD